MQCIWNESSRIIYEKLYIVLLLQTVLSSPNALNIMKLGGNWTLIIIPMKLL